ncbi:hypothetical protein CEXT_382161 [Caerostris extrusa]|uniref:Uncharacterized protein n=1 Tax=Caerostris extrusa TaxID=172846 RepID=A0AAV4V2I6_CAEEX|nr:hypothetical protein CEXT_382161 [Caerostris extrusa]
MALVFKKIGPTVLANGVERALSLRFVGGMHVVGRISKPAEDQLIKYNSLVLPKKKTWENLRGTEKNGQLGYKKKRKERRFFYPISSSLSETDLNLISDTPCAGFELATDRPVQSVFGPTAEATKSITLLYMPHMKFAGWKYAVSA